MGWLLADLVKVTPATSEAALAEWAGDGLELVGEEDGNRLYADARTPRVGIGTPGVGDLRRKKKCSAGRRGVVTIRPWPSVATISGEACYRHDLQP